LGFEIRESQSLGITGVVCCGIVPVLDLRDLAGGVIVDVRDVGLRSCDRFHIAEGVIAVGHHFSIGVGQGFEAPKEDGS